MLQLWRLKSANAWSAWRNIKCFKDYYSWLCIFVQGTAWFVSEPPISASIHYVLAWHTDLEEGVPTCRQDGRFAATARSEYHQDNSLCQLEKTEPGRHWSTQKYQGTFAKPTVSLLTYHSFLLVLLSWPSWQAPCRFRQDSLRPRKLGKRVKMSKEGWKKEKESLTTSTAFSSKGRRAVKPLQCNPNTSGKCSKAATMKTEKKPQKSQNILQPLQQCEVSVPLSEAITSCKALSPH